ncbi:MAG: hypothetical protein IIX16_04320 [Clostridia bacterium]|nr:hypothetical protein [Clostridia bacterium]
MKKFSKFITVFLSLLLVLSLFSACGKDNKTEDSKKESSTSQTTETKTEDTTEAENTTETENSTEAQDKSEVKKPTEDKNKPVDKTQNKDKDKAEDKENNKGNNSKPSQGSKDNAKPSLKVANIDLLLGSWDATFVTNGVTAKLSFTFDIIDNVVRVRFTKENYENMIKQIVEKEMSKITDEEIAESEDFSSREEAEEYFYDYLTQEIPYSSMSNQLNGTGSWKLHGDTLTINLGGETYTAETKLSEDKTSFVLVGPSGERMTLNKW